MKYGTKQFANAMETIRQYADGWFYAYLDDFDGSRRYACSSSWSDPGWDGLTTNKEHAKGFGTREEAQEAADKFGGKVTSYL